MSEALDFESELQEIDEVTKKIKIQIPAAQVEKEYKEAMGELAGTVKLKGFRSGKAPLPMVEKIHGSRVRMEVANRLISNTLNQAVGKLKLDLVGVPEIDVSSFEPGKAIEYTANLAIYPSPQIKSYQSFEVSVPKREVGETNIEEAINGLRERAATLKKIELRTSVKAGDVIEAQASITVDGEEPSRPEPLVVKLGEKSLPDEVEKGLEGLEVGEKREISAVIPDDHPNQNMRGKKATYSITLNALYDKVLPEVTDEFAKGLSAGAETVLELRMKVREMLEADFKRESDRDVQTEVLKILLKENEFNVPQAMVDDEMRHMLVRMGVVDAEKIDPARIPVEAFRDKLGPMALERVRTTIVVDRIAELENLKASEQEIEKAQSDMAESSGISLQEVRKYYTDRNHLVRLALDITRNKVMDLLVSRAKVKYTEAKAA
ncbi:MAG: trigger factor [Oligoflexia bacterium]|nr:trigger factor [Oligoflexia bacterium]